MTYHTVIDVVLSVATLILLGAGARAGREVRLVRQDREKLQVLLEETAQAKRDAVAAQRHALELAAAKGRELRMIREGEGRGEEH